MTDEQALDSNSYEDIGMGFFNEHTTTDQDNNETPLLKNSASLDKARPNSENLLKLKSNLEDNESLSEAGQKD